MEEREVEFEGAERGFDPPAGMIYICNRSSRVGIGRKIGSDKLKAVRVGDSEADKTERDLQKRMITEGTPVFRVVCDYISSMTDRFAIMKYYSLFIPKTWGIL